MTKYVSGTVPRYVAQKHGSARAFKALKREQLKNVMIYLRHLHEGCAFFPCGTGPVERADAALKELAASISAKNWGR